MADFDSQGNMLKATFADAAKEAASLAKLCNLPVSIARSGPGWAILDFPLLAQISQNTQEFEEDSFQDDDQPYVLEEDEDTRNDIVQENYEYQEGMVRSEDEGWFYEN